MIFLFWFSGVLHRFSAVGLKWFQIFRRAPRRGEFFFRVFTCVNWQFTLQTLFPRLNPPPPHPCFEKWTENHLYAVLVIKYIQYTFTCGGQYSGHQKKGTKSCPSLSRFWAELDHQTRVGILRRCLISFNLRELKPLSDTSAIGAQSGCCGHNLKTRKKYFGHFPGHPNTSTFHGL